MPREPWSPAFRRYQWRTGIAMAAYVATLFGVATIMRHHPPASVPLRYVLAAVPAFCIVAVWVALGRYLAEESDEYQRSRAVLRILWATGATMSVTTVWGFLQKYAGAANLELYLVTVIWFGFFGLASCVIRWVSR